MIGLMVPSAFAEYNEQVSVKAIFVSTIGECSDKDWIQINTILGMTSSYLGYYNINALPITRDCVPISEFPIEIQSAVTTNDLVVVIPDTLSSLFYILKTDAYGHFSFGDEDRLVIVSEAVSFGSFTNQQKIWTLSHELSHYALYEYGYPREVFGEEVHVRQDALYQCEEYDPTFASCTNLWVPLESSYTGKKYLAMRPLYIEPYMTQEQIAENSYNNKRLEYAIDYQTKRWNEYVQLKNSFDEFSYTFDFKSDSAWEFADKAVSNHNSAKSLLDTARQELVNADLLFENGDIESAINTYSYTSDDLRGASNAIDAMYENTNRAINAEKQFATLSEQQIEEFNQEIQLQYEKDLAEYNQEIERIEAEIAELKGEGQQNNNSEGGGCLIATAAFGSEMAPQVQLLREIRDNTVLQTTSGTTFMTGFNQFYYSFSPYVADYERENPIFKEAVKVTLTPMLTSLTLLNYVEIDTEEEMLGYGIGVILLNVGMYFVVPAILIISLKKRFL